MHIHNHILTFRQYLRTVQLIKGKNVDIKIPPEREGTDCYIKGEKLSFLTWTKL